MPEAISALPTAMQQRRVQLVQDDTPSVEVETPTPVTVIDESKVTISRDEFNDLQAAAGKARAAEGRAEALGMDLEALKTRLTELESVAKGNGKPSGEAPPAAADWEPLDAAYTDKDNEDYGESKSFVVKVINEQLNAVVPKLLSRIASLEASLKDIRNVADGASKTASSVKAQGYTEKVKEKLAEDGGNFDDCVNHKNWSDFTQSSDPDTGYTYAELIKSNLERENVTGMVRVFNKFREKFGVGKTKQPTGYEGALPTGVATPSNDDEGEKMLPFSERKEAHRKFINKEISFEKYEKIRQKFEAADKENRVDYNK